MKNRAKVHRHMAITALAVLFLTAILPLTGAIIGGEQAQAKVHNGTLSLQLTKTTNQATVGRGQLITYTITVKNTGTIEAKNVRVRDGIPLKLTYVPQSSSVECGMPSIGNMVLCGPVTLKPGESHSFALVFRVDDAAICGSRILNRAHAMYKLLTLSDAYVISTVSCASSSSSSSSTSSSKSSSSLTSSSRSSSSSSSSRTSSSSSSISSTSSESSESSVSSSSSSVGGCIDILKEAFDPYGNRLPVVPPFTFRLQDGRTTTNNSSGFAHFSNVPVGTQLVTEDAYPGWSQFLVTPSNSKVYVSEGSNCTGIVFKNIQTVPSSSSSSVSSSSKSRSNSSFHCNTCVSSSSSSKRPVNPCDCDCRCPDDTDQHADVDSDANTDINVHIDANSHSDVHIDQNADGNGQQNTGVNSDADTDVDVDIDANAESNVNIDQNADTNAQEGSRLWFRFRFFQQADAASPDGQDDAQVHASSSSSSIPLIVFIAISGLGLASGAFAGFRWFV